MPRRNVPISRLLSSAEQRHVDNNVVIVRVRKADLEYLIGLSRSEFRAIEKRRAQYAKKHGGEYVPAPGKRHHDKIAMEELEGIERRLCRAVGLPSMFDQAEEMERMCSTDEEGG